MGNVILDAFIATLFTFLVTTLGAGIVFIFKKVNKTIMDALLGFAAGVMLAASYFSLLGPAINQSLNLKLNTWLICLLGVLMGGLLLFISDKLFDKLFKLKSNSSKNRRIFLLISSITIHNIPEDCSCYVSR